MKIRLSVLLGAALLWWFDLPAGGQLAMLSQTDAQSDTQSNAANWTEGDSTKRGRREEKVFVIQMDPSAGALPEDAWHPTYDGQRTEIALTHDHPLNRLDDYVDEEKPVLHVDCFYPELKLVYKKYTYVVSLHCGKIVKYFNEKPYKPSDKQLANDFVFTESLLPYFDRLQRQLYTVHYAEFFREVSHKQPSAMETFHAQEEERERAIAEAKRKAEEEILAKKRAEEEAERMRLAEEQRKRDEEQRKREEEQKRLAELEQRRLDSVATAKRLEEEALASAKPKPAVKPSPTPAKPGTPPATKPGANVPGAPSAATGGDDDLDSEDVMGDLDSHDDEDDSGGDLSDLEDDFMDEDFDEEDDLGAALDDLGGGDAFMDDFDDLGIEIEEDLGDE